jgi:hypothetical protein
MPRLSNDDVIEIVQFVLRKAQEDEFDPKIAPTGAGYLDYFIREYFDGDLKRDLNDRARMKAYLRNKRREDLMKSKAAAEEHLAKVNAELNDEEN